MSNLVIYDWVSITSKIHSPQNFIELLGLQNVTWEEVKGANGYRDRLYWGCISIHYNGREDMGVWLELSGQGCRNFETFGSGNYDALFDEVRENSQQMNLTRLDISFDDHTGILNMDTLESDTRALSFVSRFKKVKTEWEWNFEKLSRGLSIYHGRKGSSVMIRIYDKAVERGFTDGRHWVRVELQLRDDRALAFLDAPGSIGERWAGVVRNYLRYVDEDLFDSNKWRWPVKRYWLELLGAVEPIRLYEKPGAEYNLSDLEQFVYRQAGNAISALLEIQGEQVFRENLRKRGTGMNPKYKTLIDQYGRAGREEVN